MAFFTSSVKIGTDVFADVTIKGRKKFGDLGKKIRKQILNMALDDIRDVISVGVVGIRNTAILSMKNSPATGRLYTGGGRSKPHIASSPGNPPRPDFGDLISSIVTEDRIDEFEVGSRITDPPYPAILEFGTKDGTEGGPANEFLEARPWLRPAFDKHGPDIKNNIIKAVKRAAAGIA